MFNQGFRGKDFFLIWKRVKLGSILGYHRGRELKYDGGVGFSGVRGGRISPKWMFPGVQANFPQLIWEEYIRFNTSIILGQTFLIFLDFQIVA